MEFRLILATIFILTKQPNQNPHQAQPVPQCAPGVKMESSCQSGCRHDPSSFYPEQPGFLTRERNMADQPTNGTDIAGSMGSLPATATRCPDTFSAKEMVSPSLRGIFQRLLAVGPSLVGSIVFLIGRDTRVSLTFRKTLAGPCSCPFPEFCSRTKYSRLKSQTKNQIDQTISPKYNQPLWMWMQTTF